MNAQRCIASRVLLMSVLLLAGMLFAAASSTPVAASPVPRTFSNPCQQVPPSGPPPPIAPVVRIEPPGTTAIDANWPIISQDTRSQTDASGGKYTITEITRRSPAAQKAVEPLAGLAQNNCTYAYDGTTQVSVNWPSGMSQYTKNYWHLYTKPGGSLSFYVVYYTEEWWMRPNTSYSVGQNATSWDWQGFNCNGGYQPLRQTGGFTPAWYNTYETYHYFYDATASWPIETPSEVSWYYLKTTETSPILYYGSPVGTMTTQIRQNYRYPP